MAVQVYFNQDNLWIIKAIDAVVNAKKLAGLETGFSFELLQLVKAGLRTDLGKATDKEVREALMRSKILLPENEQL